jgi:phage baseplate assembly protein W
MPLDFGILKKLDKPRMDQATIKSTGNTNYTWETYEGDIHLDGLNRFITLEGTTKLAQGIYKMILTQKGSNIEDPDYGTNLPERIGDKLNSEKYASIQTEIIDALVYYNAINQNNPNSDEVIETIDLVRVIADIDDPRAIKIQVSVTTESGKPVNVEVPQVI